MSIVVPIYNAEKFLRKCLESLINQTYNDIEILLVNDGSTDGSLEICKEYALKDGRVRILDQHNQGVSQARNNGILNAKCKLITFVDADDWIEDDFCEVAQESYTKSPYDILMVDAFIYQGNYRKKNEFYQNDFNEITLYIKEQLILQTINKNSAEYKPKFKVVGTTWAKIYKTEFIKKNDLKFNKSLTRAEDHIFLLNSLKNAPDVRYIKKTLYNYRKQEQSTVNKYSPNVYLEFQKTIAILNELPIVKKGDESIKKAVYARVIMNISSILANDYLHNENTDTLEKRITCFRKVVNKEPFKSSIKSVKFMDLNKKGVILTMLLRFELYKFIFKIYGKYRTTKT